jgi:3-phosphoshikimate 1-carboxyvinyltransferase
VVVEANGLRGGPLHIKGDVSSQFLSALLMAAPFARSDVTIRLTGPLVSEPYVRMTVAMLRQWHLQVHVETPVLYRIPAPQRQPPLAWASEYTIEPDASAASYFFAAAAITGGRVTVLGLPEDSLQGDVRFVDVLAEMGCRVERCSSGVTVHGRPLHGVDVDMNAISDTVMTLAAVACFAEGPTTIRNVAHIRHKETDRLAALAAELRRLGAGALEFPDGLTITPRPLCGAEVETYDDHRMAMGLAPVGLRVPGVVIKNPACVAKTYPGFFADLEKLHRQGTKDAKEIRS